MRLGLYFGITAMVGCLAMRDQPASVDDSSGPRTTAATDVEEEAEPAQELEEGTAGKAEAKSADEAPAVATPLAEAPPPPPDAVRRRVSKKAPRPARAPASIAYGALRTETMDAPSGGEFQGRDVRINDVTFTREDALSTFAIDVDTAAYSIARRTLNSNRMPTASLVRPEELINYFRYDYEPPSADDELFSIQADGARSPVDGDKHLLRVGIQARIVKQEQRLPANIVFLVDTSCSMTSEDRLPLAKKALRMAVGELGENDRVAITTYAGNVSLVLPPTNASNRKAIARAIDGLTNGGGTAMSSGMELAYQQAIEMVRDGAITRVIIFSDGDANIGATSHDEILRRIEGYVKEGVFMSTIGFGDGNYKDAMMEQLANKGNGNYYYVDSERMAERVFGRDFTKMIQDVAQDVKIQVELDPEAVSSYRLIGYENRDVADRDFRNDQVDAGEIGAGHQVTALYELTLTGRPSDHLATIRVRAKKPRGSTAKEVAFQVPTRVVDRPFTEGAEDLRFATAVMGGAELLRRSPHSAGWSFARVISIISDTRPYDDPDRAEFLSLMKKAARLSGEDAPISAR
jgi:Ca-activated chloride channel family protein